MLRAVAGTVAGSPGSFSSLTVSGQGLFASGTAALPSISFTADPTTGIYLNNPGVLAFSAGAQLRFRLSFGTLDFGPTTLQFGASVGAGNELTVLRDAPFLLGIKNSLALRGGAGFGAKAIAGSYSVVQDDFTILCSTATQGFTVMLPLSPAMNQLLNIKKVSTDANRLKIDGNGNLIDALGFQSTIETTRPNFQLQFGSTIASPTGSAWAIL